VHEPVQRIDQLADGAGHRVPSLDDLAADPTLAARLTAAARNCLLARCAAVLASLSATEPIPNRPAVDPPSPNCVTLTQLVARTGYGKSTIRTWVAQHFLIRGVHYIGDGKRRRFILDAIISRLSDGLASPAAPGNAAEPTPFVRKGRRHG